MVRAAILVSGEGTLFQSVLDSKFFGELPELELVAVIATEANDNMLRRAVNANVEAFVVEPSNFPTRLSHSMAVSNKLKDMDIDLVILAEYGMPLGVISTQFRKRIIGVYPSLVPAFCEEGCDPVAEAITRGCRVTGATAFFADIDGHIGPIILQQTVDILESDTPESLGKRILEDAQWRLLPKAVTLFSTGRLEIHGDRVSILPEPADK